MNNSERGVVIRYWVETQCNAFRLLNVLKGFIPLLSFLMANVFRYNSFCISKSYNASSMEFMITNFEDWGIMFLEGIGIYP